MTPMHFAHTEADALPSGDEARARGRKVYDALFTKGARVVALLSIAGSFFMPPDGIGFSLCAVKWLTHLPCPACGLVRSFACMSHLSPRAAWGYHPFGPLLYGVFVVLAVSNFVGAERRERIARWFEAHGAGVHVSYWSLVVAFLGYGFVRLAVAWAFPGALGVNV